MNTVFGKKRNRRERLPDIVVTEPLESLRTKIRLAAGKNKRPSGTPSGCDLLIEERRAERERELREEGW
jgi:hypothetical protein